MIDVLDIVIRDVARPGDAWGATQLGASVVVHAFRPATIATFVGVVATVECLRKLTLWPAVVAGAAAVATCAATIVSKEVVVRPDPHGWVPTHGGSFPSGHVAVIIVGLRIVLVLAQVESSRMSWALPAVGGLLMGGCLLMSATHWASDVIGGALLAIAILCGLLEIPWLRRLSSPTFSAVSPSSAVAPWNHQLHR